MKKIYLLLLSVVVMGCSDWLDVNEDPNHPTDVPTSLVLPSAQNFIATRMGGNIFNYGGFFAQYWDQAPEANQYNAESEYRIKDEYFNNDYTYLYAGALEDLEDVRNKAAEENNSGDYFVATVLRAYTFQILVDLIDMAPYTEALQGSSNPTPLWEEGSAIYSGVIAEIDDALSRLEQNARISEDLMLNKSVDQWIGFANALKLKMYMRTSYAQDNAAKVKALIDAGRFFTGNVMFSAYSNESGKRNPWYETNPIGLKAVNNVASYPIITYLSRTSDPRISNKFKLSENKNEYAGIIPGGKTYFVGAKTKDYSFPVMNPTTPVYFYTQSELQFFIAEAELRFYNDDAAAEGAYKRAIDASFAMEKVGNPGSIYDLGNSGEWISTQSLEQKMEKIMLQKWVALCMVNHFEAWTEIRRTGYPKLSTLTGQEIDQDETKYTPGQLISPIVNELGFGNLMQRLPFPEKARTLNHNTPEQKGLTTPVWWDKR